jgi:hypothetical protein
VQYFHQHVFYGQFLNSAFPPWIFCLPSMYVAYMLFTSILHSALHWPHIALITFGVED